MRTFFSIVILLVVILLALANAQAVTLSAFFWHWQVSLALVVSLSFVLGFIFGMVRVAPSLWRHSSIAKHNARMVEERNAELQRLHEDIARRDTEGKEERVVRATVE